MSRRVITQSEIINAQQKEAAGTILYNETEQKRVSEQKADDTASKILKYIPAEITAAYVAAEASVKSVTSPELEWIIFGILLLFTPFYIWRVATVTISERDANMQFKIVGIGAAATPKIKMVVPWKQILIGIGAFILWVFALGGPFAATWPTLYHTEYGSVALILYTVLIPIIMK
jgi:cation transport ATPase